MQTGLSPLSLRFTYSIFSFGYHWTSSSGDTELKKIYNSFQFPYKWHGFCQNVGHPPYPNTHTCSNQNQFKVLMISLNFSWGFVHFHWHYCNKRPTGIKSHEYHNPYTELSGIFFLYAFHYLVSGFKKSKHSNEYSSTTWNLATRTMECMILVKNFKIGVNAWRMTSNQKFIRQEIPREAKLPVHKLLQCRC